MNLPEIKIGCSDNSSIYLPTLEVPASDIDRNKTARAGCINCHTRSFDIEEVTDPIAKDRASDPYGNRRCSIVGVTSLHIGIVWLDGMSAVGPK